MSFTPTPNYALQKPTVTTEIDAWGDDLNANWDIVDTRMKLNADAAAAASALAATKANATHTHNAGTDLTGTVPAAQMPAHTGDVTSPAGSVVNTIAANAVVTAKILDANVTNAKLAVGAANTVKGTTNGTSNTDIPFATILAGGGGLANDSVTNAILANMAANTIKGSVAGGDPADLTAAQVLAVTGAATTTQLTDATTKEVQNAQSGNYSLVVGDVGKMVTFSAAAVITINSSVFAAGHRVDILQLGTGAVSFGGTATRRVFPSTATKLAGQYAGATIWFISATECVIIGNIIA